jgi:hypothetical protein
MTLHRITIAGYKAYPQTVDLNLRPVTLIYGENSTGKSSLMRILPLIQETLKNPSNSPITLSHTLTKSASLADLFSAHRNDGVIELGLHFKSNEGISTAIEYKFKSLERGDVVLLEFSLNDETRSLKAELDLALYSPGKGAVPRYVERLSKKEVPGLWFDGIMPNIGEENVEHKELVRHAAKHLRSISCFWLAPLRASVPRIKRVTKNIATIGPFGEGCIDVLYEDFMVSGPVFSDVSAWFENNCFSTLQIVPGAHEFGALASLALVRQGQTPVRVPLEDCGEGITQVLPVLVLIALAKCGRLGQDPVIVMEHPDLHLHSNAHFDIIQAIVQASKSQYKPRFLLESHAESILVATQLQVISGDLLSRNVLAVHVAGTDQGGSEVDTVEFDSSGSVKGGGAAIDWFKRTNARSLKLAKNMIGLP